MHMRIPSTVLASKMGHSCDYCDDKNSLSCLLWASPPSSPSSEVATQRMSRMTGLCSGEDYKLLGGHVAPISTEYPRKEAHLPTTLHPSVAYVPQMLAQAPPASLGHRTNRWFWTGQVSVPTGFCINDHILTAFSCSSEEQMLTGEPLLRLPANFRAAVATNPCFLLL